MEDNKKEIKTHLESFLMYEKTKKETFEKMSEAMNSDGSKRFSEKDIEKQIGMIQMMQDDIKNKYLFAGGDPNELILKQEKIEKKTQKRKVVPKTKKLLSENEVENIIVKKIEKSEPVQIKKSITEYNEVPVVPVNWNISDFTESFDVIPLPSKGECYDNNMSTIAVSYLTANDENLIVAPNL